MAYVHARITVGNGADETCQVLTSIILIVKVNQRLYLLVNSHKILPASK